MNSKLAFTAITLFAVVMGIASLSPAMAAPNNPQSNATTAVCHLFEEEFDNPETPDVDESTPAHWGELYASSKGAVNGHIKGHGDSVIGDITDLTATPPTITVADCLAQAVP